MSDRNKAVQNNGGKNNRKRAGRKPEVTRDDWIRVGLSELGKKGAGSVRLDSLCARLKITKGSFYWYFSGREEFMQLLLETWEKRDTLALIDYVEHEDGPPVKKLYNLFQAANSGRVDFRIEQAIRHWGFSDATIRQMLHLVDHQRLEYLRQQYGQICADPTRVESVASMLYSVIFGEAMIYRREATEERIKRRQEMFWAIIGLCDLKPEEIANFRDQLGANHSG